jgi:hypothetical protein
LVQNFAFSPRDADFHEPKEELFIEVKFTNGIDPDNPSKFIGKMVLTACRNQTVPNFYIQIARLVGIFPWCISIVIGRQILKHRGLITFSSVVDSRFAIVGRSRFVTDGCLVQVIVLSIDGLAIPVDHLGYPVGLPPYFPPDGFTHLMLNSGESTTNDSLPHDEQTPLDERTLSPEGMLENLGRATDKFEAAIAMQPEAAQSHTWQPAGGGRMLSPFERRRRLFVGQTKATWDVTRSPIPGGATDQEVTLWNDQELEAAQLNLQNHLDSYDTNYKEKLKAFRASIFNDPQGPIEESKAARLARDSEALLRQSRTENLWKQLLNHKLSQTTRAFGNLERDGSSKTRSEILPTQGPIVKKKT